MKSSGGLPLPVVRREVSRRNTAPQSVRCSGKETECIMCSMFNRPHLLTYSLFSSQLAQRMPPASISFAMMTRFERQTQITMKIFFTNCLHVYYCSRDTSTTQMTGKQGDSQMEDDHCHPRRLASCHAHRDQLRDERRRVDKRVSNFGLPRRHVLLRRTVVHGNFPIYQSIEQHELHIYNMIFTCRLCGHIDEAVEKGRTKQSVDEVQQEEVHTGNCKEEIFTKN